MTTSNNLAVLGKNNDERERTFLQETFVVVANSNTFTLLAAPAFVFEVILTRGTVYSFADYLYADNVLTVTSPLSAGDDVSIKYVTKKVASPLPSHTVGTGAGGCLITPAINPLDSTNIFITCDMSSAFVSHDGGETFVSTPTWGTIGTPVWYFNPHDENIVYAVVSDRDADAIYISRDKGRSWDAFLPKPDEIAGVAYYHWGPWDTVAGHVVKTSAATVLQGILGLYVSPFSADTIFITTRGTSKDTAKIYRSTDAGSTWKAIADLGTYVPTIAEAFPKYQSGIRLLYAHMLLIGEELFLVNNAGLFHINFTTRTITGKLFTNVNGTLQERAGKPVVTVIADHGVTFDKEHFVNVVVQSTDFGTTWTNLTEGFVEKLRTPEGLTMEQHQDKNYYVAPLNFKFRFLAVSGSTLYANFEAGDWRSDGTAKTTDNGANWLFVMRGSRSEFYLSEFSSLNPLDTMTQSTAVFGTAARGLAVAPSNADMVIQTDMGDAKMSIDGGLKWRSLSSRRTDSGAKPLPTSGRRPFWTTAGLEPAGMHILAVDPFDAKHRFTGWTDCGMYESFDGGQSWGFVKQTYNNCHAIAFDPHHKGVVLVGITTKQTIAAREGIDFVNDANASRLGAMARSTNNGATWTMSYNSNATANVLSDPTNSGLPARSVISSIVFDPVNVGVVYASITGAGVYKSVDGGVKWVAWNNGITLQKNKAGKFGICPHRLVPGQDNQTLFVLIHDVGTDANRNGILQRQAPIYRLDIGSGATIWQAAGRPNGNTGTMVSSLDMAADGTLYATSTLRLVDWVKVPWNGGMRYNYECGGSYVSIDGGVTWRQMYDAQLRASCIKVDSQDNNILYMSTHHGKVYMSKKGKETTAADWQELPGFNYYGAQRIFENPLDRKRIYVTTIGGGTWSLPTE